MVTIIDYGMGNLGSVEKAFKYIGEETLITNNKKNIESSEIIILPGVGAITDAINNLEKIDLIEPLKKAIKNKPFLGICLGLQMLFDKSEESNVGKRCLGILKGEVKKFPTSINLKIPHMGWNNVNFTKPSNLTKDIKKEEMFYFVHSYFLDAHHKSTVIGQTDYGINFDSCVESENIVATQFHPEKSGETGIKFLRNFISNAKLLNRG